jgi:hypothetical protein
MTTNTMVAIQTQTLATNTATVTFSSIPQNYTDLRIVINAGSTSSEDIGMQFNGDNSGGHYSTTILAGGGSSASSGRTTSVNGITIDSNGFDSTSIAKVATVDIMNYSNTTTYKTALCRSGNAGTGVDAIVGLWRPASLGSGNITSITFYGYNSGYSFLAGSTFSLYGIANADIGAYATGGIITQDANYYYHAFGNSGTFTPSRALTADILVVAGGGGGGGNMGGGGGAGGVLGFASQSLANGTGYSCIVGAGGAGAPGNSPAGSNGGNSQFAALTATVGGGGGGSLTASVKNGVAGGSGGGGAGGYDGGSGGSGGSASQGYAGGSGASGSNGNLLAAAGGGGFASVGTNGSGLTGTSVGGTGGSGTNTVTNFANLSTALSVVGVGTNGYLAGGGGGGVTAATGAVSGSGTNGGGKGGGLTQGSAGAVNTGSGGGGGGNGVPVDGTIGYAGGSGLIIVRYAK